MKLKKNGGTRIPISGNPANHPKHEKAYKEYKETGNHDTAREEIGGIFTDGDKTGDKLRQKNILQKPINSLGDSHH